MTLESSFARLEELSQLKDDWHPYEFSKAPTKEAMDTMKRILPLLTAKFYIYPVPDGGLQIEWEDNDFAYEINVSSNGIVICMEKFSLTSIDTNDTAITFETSYDLEDRIKEVIYGTEFNL